jgi:hypothetical protein
MLEDRFHLAKDTGKRKAGKRGKVGSIVWKMEHLTAALFQQF